MNYEHSESEKEGHVPCKELNSKSNKIDVDVEKSSNYLIYDSESDPMNLKLLNPLCMDSDGDDDIAKTDHSTMTSSSKIVPGNGVLSENIKGIEQKIEKQNAVTSTNVEQSDATGKSMGQPRLVNIPSQPMEDAALPNSQELPDDSAHTESLYKDNSQTKKNIPSDEQQVTNVSEKSDEELAMQEMMDLEAEDLEESQLSSIVPGENATVPSLSPQGLYVSVCT